MLFSDHQRIILTALFGGNQVCMHGAQAGASEEDDVIHVKYLLGMLRNAQTIVGLLLLLTTTRKERYPSSLVESNRPHSLDGVTQSDAHLCHEAGVAEQDVLCRLGQGIGRKGFWIHFAVLCCLLL